MSSKSDRRTKRPKETKGRQPTSDPKHQPCGCIEQLFDDETVDIQPCPAHGLMEAAKNLIAAGQSLGSVGVQLFNAGVAERNDENNRKANEEVGKAIEDGTILDI